MKFSSGYMLGAGTVVALGMAFVAGGVTTVVVQRRAAEALQRTKGAATEEFAQNFFFPRRSRRQSQ